MESRFSNGMDAHGEWNNRTWLVQAEVSRSIQYAGGWTVSPFLRMEFTHGTEASFLEDGSYARKFEGAVLRRLSIPAGVSVERSGDWKGRPWTQVLRLSYVGDAIQDVPEASVYSIYSDIFWRAVVSNQPAMPYAWSMMPPCSGMTAGRFMPVMAWKPGEAPCTTA